MMSYVFRWGDRDMLQPSDLTRQKKKRKIFFKYCFSFYCNRKIISTVEERVELQLHPSWYYDIMETKM
jgi:hypothetical protein